jgi:hypothetical protein
MPENPYNPPKEGYPWRSVLVGAVLGGVIGWLVAYMALPGVPDRQPDLTATGPLTVFIVAVSALIGAVIMRG